MCPNRPQSSTSIAPPLPPVHARDDLNFPTPQYQQKSESPSRRIDEKESATAKITTFGVVLTTVLLAIALFVILVVIPRIKQNIEIRDMLDKTSTGQVGSSQDESTEKNSDVEAPNIILADPAD